MVQQVADFSVCIGASTSNFTVKQTNPHVDPFQEKVSANTFQVPNVDPGAFWKPFAT